MVIPKLADPDSSCVSSGGTPIAKKRTVIQEIWAQRSSADVSEDESRFPQFSIRLSLAAASLARIEQQLTQRDENDNTDERPKEYGGGRKKGFEDGPSVAPAPSLLWIHSGRPPVINPFF